jgi:hypothetical protein
MTQEEFTVEYYEEHSKRFRAINVSCDKPEYADVEAMKQGAKILKVSKVYRKGDKTKTNLFKVKP